MKKWHVATKTIVHCVVGLIEVILIPMGIACLTLFIEPFENDGKIWQMIERTILCFFFYESILIYVRKMIVDTRKDALFALKAAHEKVILCCETGSEKYTNELLKKIEKVTSSGVLNQLDIINSYQNLSGYINSKNINCIRSEIITIDHEINTNDLLWNFTLVLRYFK